MLTHATLLAHLVLMSADPRTLADQLQSPEAAARVTAAEELGRLGDEARPAAVAMVRAVADVNSEVRDLLTGCLEDLGAPDPADSAALGKLLAHDEADVAYWAATLLGRLESDAAACVGALTEAVAGQQADIVRERAAWALGKIGPAAKEALPALEAVGQGAQSRLARLANEARAKIAGGE